MCVLEEAFSPPCRPAHAAPLPLPPPPPPNSQAYKLVAPTRSLSLKAWLACRKLTHACTL
ncbi:hypothetical protein E2C01_082256 [Portunus trituberculatus]|uniref:Uncharacterized protein n=1 Tax=Portunus trituberculatus TaxID=210409 RepID=A0A5B7IXZ6_PORTR|nr:hypothetical protein [Portunus trituberculatus]